MINALKQLKIVRLNSAKYTVTNSIIERQICQIEGNLSIRCLDSSKRLGKCNLLYKANLA